MVVKCTINTWQRQYNKYWPCPLISYCYFLLHHHHHHSCSVMPVCFELNTTSHRYWFVLYSWTHVLVEGEQRGRSEGRSPTARVTRLCHTESLDTSMTLSLKGEGRARSSCSSASPDTGFSHSYGLFEEMFPLFDTRGDFVLIWCFHKGSIGMRTTHCSSSWGWAHLHTNKGAERK